MKKISLLIALLSGVAFAQTGEDIVRFKDLGLSPSTRKLVTTASMNLYVGTTGSDSNLCTSATYPCATIQGAVNKVPKRIRHPVVITVGAGTFTAGARISGFAFEDPANISTGSSLLITGTFATATPTTGLATGTVASATAGSTSTWGTVTVTGAGWTTNDLRGKFLVITSGTGAGTVRVISSNTATVITVAGLFGTLNPAPAAGSTFAIQQAATVISGDLTSAPGPGSPTLPAAAAFVIEGMQSPLASSAANNFVIQRFKIASTVTRGFYIATDSSLQLRNNRCEVISNGRCVYLGQNGSVRNVGWSINMTGTTTSFVEQVQNYMARYIATEDSVSDGGGNWAYVTAAAMYRSNWNSVIGSLRVHHFASLLDANIKYDKYATTGETCIRGDASNGDLTMGLLTVGDVVFGTCTTRVIWLTGPVRLGFADVSGSTGSGAYGIEALEGTHVLISSTTAVTGTTADLKVDGSTSSYATLRGATPKVLKDANFFSVIYER
jgi:hypothetical protein